MGQENFKEMRKAMVVSQLRTTDVSDPRVIGAMAEVAREDFVPSANRSIAYSDRGVGIGEDRALNTPLATGLLINAAQIRSDDNVLIVGAATGYTAAVVSKLARSVVALEQSAKLVSKAKANLEAIENVSVEKGKLADLIIVDGDPSKDLRVLAERSNIKAVVKNGEFITNDLEPVAAHEAA